LPRNKVMVIATGGQGEPRAALARIAEGSHPIKLDQGDRVIYSSKQIPGNEIAIGRIMNRLAERGIETVTEKQLHIHVSGHPGRPELAAMYGWVRPDTLGREQGIPHTVVQKNGQLVRLAPGEATVISEVQSGRLILDGDMIVSADGGVINERRRLSQTGHVVVAVSGRHARINARGLPIEPDDMDRFVNETTAAAESAASSREANVDRRREAIRLAVRRCATDWTGKKPLVDVLLFDS
jgi:ribonuclease J